MYVFRRTTLLLVGFIAFLLGVGISHSGQLIGPDWVIIILALGLFSFRKKNIWALVWVILLAGSLGWWRGSVYMQKLGNWEAYYGHKVTISVIAANDGVYSARSQLAFSGTHAIIDGRELTGRVQVSGFGENAVFQGDAVEITGKLKPALGAYEGQLGFAQLHVAGHHPSLVANIRRNFAAGMQNALPEPLASFAMGLLIGQRATLPQDVKQDLLMVGLTHIIAVSGYNLTIILRAGKGILGKRSKRISTLLSLGVIALFLLLTGSSASIIRAAIVSMLSIGAGYYGRQVKPLLLIAMAAAITAFANPFYVWTDTSWYLSFLAFYGVMVLAPMIAVRLHLKWQNSLVAMVALESLCAELMTLPFVLHTFGQMSFIGLVANVLVVALVPLAMLLSLIAGLAGMFIAPVSGWFAWPARILLTYMLDIAHLLSRIPHIFVQHIGLAVGEMLALYFLIVGITILLWYKTKQLKSAYVLTDKGKNLY